MKSVDVIKSYTKYYLRDEIERFFDDLQERIDLISKRVISKLAGGAFIIVGVVFLVVAAYYSLREIAGFGNTTSFLIIGGISIIIGFVIRR